MTLLLVWFGIFCGVAMTTVLVTSSCYLSLSVGCTIFLPEGAAACAPAHLGPVLPTVGTTSPCPAPGEPPAGRDAGKYTRPESGML